MRDGDEFRRTIRRGASAASDSVVSHVAMTDGPGVRVGLVVGKKVGNSVVRNRVKRRIRHAVAPEVAGLPEGSRVVFRALAPAAMRHDLSVDVVDCLHRAVRRSAPGRG